jgi:hypothetical protein
MGTGAAGRDPGGRTTSNAGGATSGVGSIQAGETLSHTHIQNSHFHHTGIGLIDLSGGQYGAVAGGGNQRYVNMSAGNPAVRWNGNTITPTNQSTGGDPQLTL